NTYIDLMYTVTGSNIDTCWYTINNGPAILLENCENTEFRITEPGDYTIRVYANNSAGNIGMSSRTFTIVWQIHTREDIYRPVVVQEREHIHIESFTLDRDDYSLQSNRETEVFLRFRNTGNFEIRNIQATVSIPELGVWDRATVHRLRVGQAETLNLYLGLPHVEPGFYYVRLTLAGQGDRLGMNGYSRGIWYEVYIQ
ncbi:MAG: hypothetical protein ACMXYK_05230, partial [Candidatus Woesearchaeota archaeon]